VLEVGGQAVEHLDSGDVDARHGCGVQDDSSSRGATLRMTRATAREPTPTASVPPFVGAAVGPTCGSDKSGSKRCTGCKQAQDPARNDVSRRPTRDVSRRYVRPPGREMRDRGGKTHPPWPSHRLAVTRLGRSERVRRSRPRQGCPASVRRALDARKPGENRRRSRIAWSHHDRAHHRNRHTGPAAPGA
jgi:hypothetical protein